MSACCEHWTVRAALRFSARQLDEALSVSPAGSLPGGTPVPYTVLTGPARQFAAGWFPLRPPPAA